MLTVGNCGGALLLLALVAWQLTLASPSDVDCRHSGPSYSSCRGVRWLHPCRGSSSLDLPMETVVDEPDRVFDLDLSQALATIHSTASRLSRELKSVIDLYVMSRFGNEQTTRKLDAMRYRIDGMPNVEQDGYGPKQSELAPNIHKAYDHFARIAVFLAQMIKDDRETTTENVYFETHFETLESGLYHILCSLMQIIVKLERPLSSETVGAILDLRVAKADWNSMRHMRDYLILRDFEKITDSLSKHFGGLTTLKRLLNTYEILG